MLGERGQHVHGQEEQVLREDGHFVEQACVDTVGSLAAGRVGLLDPRPRDVHVEQDQQGAQTQDARVEFVIGAPESVEEEMAVDLFTRVVNIKIQETISQGHRPNSNFGAFDEVRSVLLT